MSVHHKNRDQPLLVHLFDLFGIFVEKHYEFFPLKKTLSLIWKCTLATLGGNKIQEKCMNHARQKYDLPPVRQGFLPFINLSSLLCVSSYPPILEKPDIYTKATLEDVEKYEQEITSKFFGMNPNPSRDVIFSNRLDSVFSTLPIPIQDGYEALKRSVYTPLSSRQLKVPILSFFPTFLRVFKALLFSSKAFQEQVNRQEKGPHKKEDHSEEIDEENFDSTKSLHSEDEMCEIRISHMAYLYVLSLLISFWIKESKSLQSTLLIRSSTLGFCNLQKILHNDIARILIVFLKILLATVPSVKKYTGTLNLGAELKMGSLSLFNLKLLELDNLKSPFSFFPSFFFLHFLFLLFRETRRQGT